MLTSKQPPVFGQREAHDLPTPPATNRQSPQSIYRESYKSVASSHHSSILSKNSLHLSQMSSHGRLPLVAPLGPPSHPSVSQSHSRGLPPSHPGHGSISQQHIPASQQHPPPPHPHMHPPHQQHMSPHPSSQHHPPLPPPSHQHHSAPPPSLVNQASPIQSQQHQPPPPHLHHPPPPQQLGPQSSTGHQHSQSVSRPPVPYEQSSSLGFLPPPPYGGSSDEVMKSWLAAKAEDEKRRQEEEKTKQETLRRDQRQIELEILKHALSGGIPPSVIPIVFAGMGGVALPPGALEWGQHVVQPATLPSHGPLVPGSPSRRDSQPYSAYAGPSSAGSTHGFVLAGSPAARGGSGRNIIMPPSNRLSTINTGGPGSYPPNYSSNQLSANSEPQSGGGQNFYFHHWQPPSSTSASQQPTAAVSAGSSSGQQAAPPAESPKKRKATGPPLDSRSPFPFSPTRRRLSHIQQRSDLGASYRSEHHRTENIDTGRDFTPISLSNQHPGPSTSAPPREAYEQSRNGGGGGHSVSSLLADEPQGANERPKELRESERE